MDHDHGAGAHMDGDRTLLLILSLLLSYVVGLDSETDQHREETNK